MTTTAQEGAPAAVIVGRAYQRPATLEIGAAGETLIWRAQRGALPTERENVVTPVHELRGAQYLEVRASLPGLAVLALGGLWAATEGLLPGIVGAVAGTALVGHRLARPRRSLLLVLADRRLQLEVAPGSAAAARALARRVTRMLAAGEVPALPPTLP